jgi:general secretion pathway protein I
VRAGGFSLLEMLVALAVFALVVLALLNLSGENARTAAVIEERVFAGVVADNRAVEASLAPADDLRAEATGRDDSGGRTWRWTRRMQATDDPAIVRVDIAVMPMDEDRIAAEASLFRSAR